ncbi:MAG: hypothetical protein QM723_14675 [Myxococcaceae bacterium]
MLTSGLPDTLEPHWSHDTPASKPATGAFGTYTSAFTTGSGLP